MTTTVRPPLLLLLFLGLLAPANAGSAPDLSSHPVYSQYRFGGAAKVADLGTQPLAVPLGVAGEVMKHDRIFKKALAERGWEFRSHGFLKGPDVNFFFKRGDLDIAMAGDFPTITIAASEEILVAALVKQGFSSLVARDAHRVQELKGKRIGVALGTTAHHCLLVALEGAGLKESDVTMVPLENSGIIAALDEERLDAFASWEPTTTAALRLYPELNVLQRVLTSNYLYFSKSFVRQHPEIAALVMASYIRSLRWLRTSNRHLDRAVGWEIAAGEQLVGGPTNLSPSEVSRITTTDLLKIARHPAVPRQELAEYGGVHHFFKFLKAQGKIPADVPWERIAGSFDWDLIDKVLADPKKYQLLQFDYDE